MAKRKRAVSRRREGSARARSSRLAHLAFEPLEARQLFSLNSSAIIFTVAGDGSAFYNGDKVAATATSLWAPTGVAFDSSGDLFIDDSANARIREVNQATGVITTIAGNGVSGFSGDNGPATAAQISWTTDGIAVDTAGDVFIADSENNRIREVNHATGIITTIAGNGTAGFAGDSGPATAAELSDPSGIALDPAGDIFISDTGNSRVREISAATGDITTVAGTSTSGYNGDGIAPTAANLDSPQQIAFDSQGDLFIADTGNLRIREVNATSGLITTVAGDGVIGSSGNGGPATAAKFEEPTGVAVDSAGDVFIADLLGYQVREVNATNGTITAVAGSTSGYSGDGGLATAAELNLPTSLAFDAAGDLVVSDHQNDRIREISNPTPALSVSDNGGTYNTSAFSATALVNGGASLEGITPAISYYSGTAATGTALSGVPSAAGTYTVLASFAGSTDYSSAATSTTFTIAQATPTLTVSDNSGTFTGTAYAASDSITGVGSQSTATASLESVAPTLTYYSGTAVTGSALAGAPSSAGTYTVSASFAGSADYTATTGSATFTISQASPVVSVSDNNGIFTGSPFTAATSSIEGITPTLVYYSGTTTSGTGSTSAPSSAGTYTVVASFFGSPDYTPGTASTQFTINQALPTILVVDNGGTYTTAAYRAAANSIEGASPTLSYYSGTAASGSALSGAPSVVGTYSALASFAGSADYSSGSAGTTFSITKAVATVGINSLAGPPWVAGVGSQSAQAASLEGVTPSVAYYSGTAASGTALGSVPTTQGTYTAVVSFAGSTDYNPVAGSATFTISTATPTVLVSDPGGSYKGSAYSATATVNSSASLEGVTPTLSYYSGTAASGSSLPAAPSHAGTYTVVASFAGSTDDGPAHSNPATFVISPAPLTITANNQTMAYGGPLPTLTASYSGFQGSDSAASLTTQPTLSTTATATSPITGNPYPITARGAVDPDYAISYVAGQLTVTSAVPPSSTVEPLGYRTSSTSIDVSWSGTPGTGGPIQSYTIWVSVDGGAFAAWQSNTSATSAIYNASIGHTYGFISQATDAAGSVEAQRTTADTSVTVTAAPWTYPGNPLNVIGLPSGTIVPADVLAIIDYLNSHPGGGSLPATAPLGSGYYDVLGGDSVVPADALAVIDYLNQNPASPGVVPAVAAAPADVAAPNSDGKPTAASPSAAAGLALTAAASGSVAVAGPAPVSPAVTAVASLPAAATTGDMDSGAVASMLPATGNSSAFDEFSAARRESTASQSAGNFAVDAAFSAVAHAWWSD